MLYLKPLMMALIVAQSPFVPVTNDQPGAKVQVQLRNARLEDAIRDIARQANLGVSYRPDLPQLDRMVTISMSGTAGNAILRVLQNTDIEALVSSSGNTLLLRRRARAQRDVELSIETPPIPIAEVIVTPGHFGIAHESGNKPQALSREQIETLPQLGEDVFRAVNRLPGMSSNEYSAKFSVRGGDDQSMLVRLDGLELYEPFHLKDFDGALSIIDVASIGGVDVNTGGFGAEFGNRLTGVFDMRTTSAITPRPRTSIGISLSNARVMSQGSFANDNGLWLFAARRGYLDILLDLIGETSRVDPRYYDVLGKVVYQVTPKHRISLHALRAGDKGFLEDDDGVGSITSTYGSSYGWGTWDFAITDRMDVSTQLSAGNLDWVRDASEHGTGNDFDIQEDRDFAFYGVKQDWRFSTDQVLLKWGGEVRSGSANYDYYRRVGRGGVVNGEYVIRYDSLDIALSPEGTNTSAYAAARVRPFRALTMEAGLRWDRQSHTSESQLLPRVNAALAIDGRTTLRAMFGRYAQPQALFQVQIRDGDTTFYPAESAYQFVVGVERMITSDVAARVEAYRRDESDLRPRFRNLAIAPEPVAEIEDDRVRIDARSGLAQGVEFFVQKRAGRTMWSVSYALAHAFDNVGGREIDRPLDQRHTLYTDYSIAPGGGWRLSAAWQYHTGWPATESTFVVDTLNNGGVVISSTYGQMFEARLPSYHRLDLRATRTIPFKGGRLSLFIDVFNAYDRANAQSLEYNVRYSNGRLSVDPTTDPMLPRLPTIGATWEF